MRILLGTLLAIFAPCITTLAQVQQAWVARYNGPDNKGDAATALAVDSAGNVYVTGSSPVDPRPAFATVKYDTNGNQLWVARYNGPHSYDAAGAIAVDNAGNVYVNGSSEGTNGDTDFATVKYDANGNQLWVARYNGPGNESDYSYRLVLDSAGNVYVAGESVGSGTGLDFATVKYDADGNQLWVARYDGPASGYDYDVLNALAVDAIGNVYVTGESGGDYATVKYDPRGNQLWVARYSGPGDFSDAAQALAVDTRGNVYVSGYSYGSDGCEYATVKYDADGSQLWVAHYRESIGCGRRRRIAVDGAGNVYVTGSSGTVKYDTDGRQLWVARYSAPANGGYSPAR